MAIKEILQKIISDLKENINEAEKIVIFPHLNPDADSLGASLALYNYLIKINKKVDVISPNRYPKFLNWMHNNYHVKIATQNPDRAKEIIQKADLLFFMDFNELKRLDRLIEAITEAKGKKIIIDHHPDANSVVDIKIVDTSVSSTCELLYHVFDNLNIIDKIDKNIAECIFAGIITDTGVFSYNSSTTECFFVVAELLKHGIDKDKVYDRIYNQFSHSRVQLLGYCLNKKLQMFAALNTAYMSITEEELAKFNFMPGDTEGFVNHLLTIKSIRFVAFFQQSKNIIKISFRSKRNFAVNHFAREHFNGGGHLKAAGGMSNENMEDTLKKFEKNIINYKEELTKEYF